MKNWKILITFVSLLILILGSFHSVNAQGNLAQQAYAIFEQSCLDCHGEHGIFSEVIIIDHTALIETGVVVPGKPIESELYNRLRVNDPAKRMPLGQPKLPPAAILTIGDWIQAGAPNWEDTVEAERSFITPKEMLEAIEKHVNSLSPFDRTFARYFTMTHLYNAGETAEALHVYRRALSKLVNSLSWGREVIKPQPIDSEETIFYIDLRDYEWEIGTNRWTQIEQVYPYSIEFNAPTQTNLREKLTTLREAMDCEVPFVYVDWFIATAALPPLYHDILYLPQTDRELEARLEVNVVENLRNAAGRRVRRAGFNNSADHNRVVERHNSRYGAYWKSYNFTGILEAQNIFKHPLSFEHDGGEIIFNLPNGLQAYFLVDDGGNRLNESIVSYPFAYNPPVRNGLSCIGCHTEGMKDFEDQVRGAAEKNPNPPFDKDRVLRLYTDKATMAGLVAADTDRYKRALEATGNVFGRIEPEPVWRSYEAFRRPVDAAYAAAALGVETEAFLKKIRDSANLKSLGVLVLENGMMKRDTWTSKFSEIVFALDFPDVAISDVQVAPGKYPPLYWIDAKTDTLQKLVDTEVKNLVSEAQNATSLAVDTVNKKLYWTEKTGNRTGKIQRANLDGTNIQLVKDLTSAPLDITLDTAGGKLYWTNAWGKIQRMNLDGSNFQPNLITGLKAPQNLVLDTTNSQLYWTEQTGKTTGEVQRANLDGNPNVKLVKALTSAPRGMTLDAVNRKLYLTNAWGKLQRMNLNGSNFESNLITGLVSPGQVAVDVVGGKVYWTEQGKLRRADLNGENIQDVVTGLGELTDIGLGIDSVGEMGVAAAPVLRTVVEQTQLLANYPNPFNPETWIPYQLSEAAEVTLRIYSVNGELVRTLVLGQVPAGIYQSRSRAAYWDGRNALGESVASGVYFYTFTAGEFTATRRMLILK